MYYWIQYTEDGMVIACYTYDALLERIRQETSDDIIEEYRVEFVTTVPMAYGKENQVLIIKGEPVEPYPKEKVVEWVLP